VMIVAMLRGRPVGAFVVVGAVLCGMAVPWVIRAIPSLAPYAHPAVVLPFVLLGAAWSSGAAHVSLERRRYAIASLVLLLALAMYHQWGAMLAALGLLLGAWRTKRNSVER